MDWLAAAAEGQHDATIQYFENWREMSFQMGASSATMPHDMSIPQLVDQVGFITAHSETWFITEDISALVQDASYDMPPHSMRPEDLPCPMGWMYFETPLEMLATDGSIYKIKHALAAARCRRRHTPPSGRDAGARDVVLLRAGRPDSGHGHDRERKGSPTPRTSTSRIKIAFQGRTSLIPVTFGVLGNGRIPWVAMQMNDDGSVDEAAIVPTEYAWVAKNHHLEKAFQDFYAKSHWNDDEAPIPEGVIEKDGSEDGRWIVRTPNGERVLIYPDPTDRWFLALLRFLQQKLPAHRARACCEVGRQAHAEQGHPDWTHHDGHLAQARGVVRDWDGQRAHVSTRSSRTLAAAVARSSGRALHGPDVHRADHRRKTRVCR